MTLPLRTYAPPPADRPRGRRVAVAARSPRWWAFVGDDARRAMAVLRPSTWRRLRAVAEGAAPRRAA